MNGTKPATKLKLSTFVWCTSISRKPSGNSCSLPVQTYNDYTHKIY